MRPDSLPRLWRYINILLTYLLSFKFVTASSSSNSSSTVVVVIVIRKYWYFFVRLEIPRNFDRDEILIQYHEVVKANNISKKMAASRAFGHFN